MTLRLAESGKYKPTASIDYKHFNYPIALLFPVTILLSIKFKEGYL